MRLFRAFAEDEKGKKYSGTFEAPNEHEARRMLISEGYRIVSLAEVGAGRMEGDRVKFREDAKGAQGDQFRDKNPQRQGPVYWAKFLASGGGKKSLGIFKPYLLGGIVLLALPWAISHFAPPRTAHSSEDTVIRYFDEEFVGAFQDQFELFSKNLKSQWGSPEAYGLMRRSEANPAVLNPVETPLEGDKASTGPAEPQVPILESLEKVKEEKRKAGYFAYVREGGLWFQYHLQLVIEGKAWKIESLDKKETEPQRRVSPRVNPKPAAGANKPPAFREGESLREVREAPQGKVSFLKETSKESSPFVEEARQWLEEMLRKGQISRQEYEARLGKLKDM